MKSYRDTLIAYLKCKVKEGDWHGVSDAANDLRELEARDRGYTEGELSVMDRETKYMEDAKELRNEVRRLRNELELAMASPRMSDR